MEIKNSSPCVDESDVTAVTEVIKSGIHGTFDKVKEFENKLCELTGLKYGKATTSGTTAIHLALLSLDIKEGDEVILPSYVCHTVLGAVYQTRAKPVLADIDSDYVNKGFNISARTIKSLINENTKAIIVPHMFGVPAEIDEIVEVGVPVIEDCCSSLGAYYKGKITGSFGKISVFSFYATKVISSGHGGMVLTSDEKIKEKIKDLTQYDGREKTGLAFNYNLSDIQAALGLSQLKKLDDFIKKRSGIGKLYGDVFSKLGIRLNQQIEGSFPFKYIIVLKNKDDRERVESVLKEKQVGVTRPVFKPLHQYLDLNVNDFKNTEESYDCVLALPCYPALSNEEVDRVIDAVRGCF